MSDGEVFTTGKITIAGGAGLFNSLPKRTNLPVAVPDLGVNFSLTSEDVPSACIHLPALQPLQSIFMLFLLAISESNTSFTLLVALVRALVNY
jgi:hypothetical protein